MDGLKTRLENISMSYSREEVSIPNKGIKGKLKLGFTFLDTFCNNDRDKTKIENIYIKFQDKSKRLAY